MLSEELDIFQLLDELLIEILMAIFTTVVLGIISFLYRDKIEKYIRSFYKRLRPDLLTKDSNWLLNEPDLSLHYEEE